MVKKQNCVYTDALCSRTVLDIIISHNSYIEGISCPTVQPPAGEVTFQMYFSDLKYCEAQQNKFKDFDNITFLEFLRLFILV